MNEMRVEQPGLFSLIQDLGRYGHQRYGIPVNGAMDEWAHRTANVLVGNDEDAATLECTLIGPTIRFTHNTLIAISGGDLHATIEGRRLPLNRAVMVRRDVPITFMRHGDDARAYLAVRGGLHVPSVLGSRSTFARGVYGGHEGRALRRGDRVPIGSVIANMLSIERLLVQSGTSFVVARDVMTPDVASAAPAVRPAMKPDENASTASSTEETTASNGRLRHLRFIRGPQWRHFTRAARTALLDQTYTVTQQSDRMGYRLQGAALLLKSPLEMISEAVNAGTIQVPPNGQPIVLMADRQTAGGYPKIGYVISTDLGHIAQALPGDRLRFTAVSSRHAEGLLWARYQRIAEISAAAAKALA